MLKKKGFTLIELLVVVAIISLLAAIAVPRLADRIRRARMVKAEADIKGIENALAMLMTDAGASLLLLLEKEAVMPVVQQLTGADNLYQLYVPPIPRRRPPNSRVAGWPYGGPGWNATPLVRGLFMSTLEYAPGAYWGGGLKTGVYKNLSNAYMDKGVPKDPWGNEYRIFLAPPGRLDRYDWARGGGDYAADERFPGLKTYGPSGPYPAPSLDYYIYSLGENRTDDNLTGSRNGYDDINNWDASRGWAEVYR